jgi:hypothetical protein
VLGDDAVSESCDFIVVGAGCEARAGGEIVAADAAGR